MAHGSVEVHTDDRVNELLSRCRKPTSKFQCWARGISDQWPAAVDNDRANRLMRRRMPSGGYVNITEGRNDPSFDGIPLMRSVSSKMQENMFSENRINLIPLVEVCGRDLTSPTFFFRYDSVLSPFSSTQSRISRIEQLGACTYCVCY